MLNTNFDNTTNLLGGLLNHKYKHGIPEDNYCDPLSISSSNDFQEYIADHLPNLLDSLEKDAVNSFDDLLFQIPGWMQENPNVEQLSDRILADPFIQGIDKNSTVSWIGPTCFGMQLAEKIDELDPNFDLPALTKRLEQLDLNDIAAGIKTFLIYSKIQETHRLKNLKLRLIELNKSPQENKLIQPQIQNIDAEINLRTHALSKYSSELFMHLNMHICTQELLDNGQSLFDTSLGSAFTILGSYDELPLLEGLEECTKECLTQGVSSLGSCIGIFSFLWNAYQTNQALSVGEQLYLKLQITKAQLEKNNDALVLETIHARIDRLEKAIENQNIKTSIQVASLFGATVCLPGAVYGLGVSTGIVAATATATTVASTAGIAGAVIAGAALTAGVSYAVYKNRANIAYGFKALDIKSQTTINELRNLWINKKIIEQDENGKQLWKKIEHKRLRLYQLNTEEKKSMTAPVYEKLLEKKLDKIRILTNELSSTLKDKSLVNKLKTIERRNSELKKELKVAQIQRTLFNMKHLFKTYDHHKLGHLRLDLEMGFRDPAKREALKTFLVGQGKSIESEISLHDVIHYILED